MTFLRRTLKEFPSLFEGVWLTSMARMSDLDDIPDALQESVRKFLLEAANNGRNASLNLDISSFGEQNETMLANAIQAIAKKSQFQRETKLAVERDERLKALPRLITFPYSRHASYPELCHLVSALKPLDVWPCTVSPIEWFKNDISINRLFGQHCRGTTFRHDILMDELREDHESSQSQSQHDTQQTNISFEVPMMTENLAEEEVRHAVTETSGLQIVPGEPQLAKDGPNDLECTPELGLEQWAPTVLRKRDYAEYEADLKRDVDYRDVIRESQDSEVSELALDVRLTAFQAMLANTGNGEWQEIGLLSTCEEERVLGDR